MSPCRESTSTLSVGILDNDFLDLGLDIEEIEMSPFHSTDLDARNVSLGTSAAVPPRPESTSRTYCKYTMSCRVLIMCSIFILISVSVFIFSAVAIYQSKMVQEPAEPTGSQKSTMNTQDVQSKADARSMQSHTKTSSNIDGTRLVSAELTTPIEDDASNDVASVVTAGSPEDGTAEIVETSEEKKARERAAKKDAKKATKEARRNKLHHVTSVKSESETANIEDSNDASNDVASVVTTGPPKDGKKKFLSRRKKARESAAKEVRQNKGYQIASVNNGSEYANIKDQKNVLDDNASVVTAGTMNDRINSEEIARIAAELRAEEQTATRMTKKDTEETEETEQVSTGKAAKNVAGKSAKRSARKEREEAGAMLRESQHTSNSDEYSEHSEYESTKFENQQEYDSDDDYDNNEYINHNSMSVKTSARWGKHNSRR